MDSTKYQNRLDADLAELQKKPCAICESASVTTRHFEPDNRSAFGLMPGQVIHLPMCAECSRSVFDKRQVENHLLSKGKPIRVDRNKLI